jgi:hypothetical protein
MIFASFVILTAHSSNRTSRRTQNMRVSFVRSTGDLIENIPGLYEILSVLLRALVHKS